MTYDYYENGLLRSQTDAEGNTTTKQAKPMVQEIRFNIATPTIRAEISQPSQTRA